MRAYVLAIASYPCGGYAQEIQSMQIYEMCQDPAAKSWLSGYLTGVFEAKKYTENLYEQRKN